MAERFAAQLADRKRGETEKPQPIPAGRDWKEYKEEQYDRLADLVRRSLDMKKVYEILDQGV